MLLLKGIYLQLFLQQYSHAPNMQYHQSCYLGHPWYSLRKSLSWGKHRTPWATGILMHITDRRNTIASVIAFIISVLDILNSSWGLNSPKGSGKGTLLVFLSINNNLRGKFLYNNCYNFNLQTIGQRDIIPTRRDEGKHMWLLIFCEIFRSILWARGSKSSRFSDTGLLLRSLPPHVIWKSLFVFSKIKFF